MKADVAILRISSCVRLVLAAVGLASAGCAAGGGGSVATSTAAPPSLAAASGARAGSLAPDVLTPHIYVPQTVNGVPTLLVFNEQGNKLATTGTFPNLGPIEFGTASDSNNHSIYVLSSDCCGTSLVTAYDGQGGQKHFGGSFAHLPMNPAVGGIIFDSHNKWLYILTEGRGADQPTIKAYNEQGYLQQLSGGFPNLGRSGYSLMYDAHNGLIYYGGDSTGYPNPTYFVAAFDDAGNPQTLSGSFPVGNHGYDDPPNGMTYDAADGLIYWTDVRLPSGDFSIAAFDEQGNPQTLSPGFPNGIARTVRFDANAGFIYASTYGPSQNGLSVPTITAWDGQGNPQPLSGHFDYPNATVYDFVISQ